jgi:hypothetical protein
MPSKKNNSETENTISQPEPTELETVIQISEEELANVVGAGARPALMQTEYAVAK